MRVNSDTRSRVQPDVGVDPREVIPQPEFLDQRDDVRVGAEQVVVEDLDAAAADLERPHLAAGAVARLVHCDLMAALREVVCGGEARHARADHDHLHRATSIDAPSSGLASAPGPDAGC
jgi:hypothetical protein